MRFSSVLTKRAVPFAFSRLAVVAVAACAALVVCVVVADLLFEARIAATKRAAHEVSNLAFLITHDIERNIQLLDLALMGATSGVTDPTVMAAPRPLRQRLLFDRAVTTDGLGTIFLLDPKGDVIADTVSDPPAPLNLGDRGAFRAHLERRATGLYVGVPVRSRVDGAWVLALSRRIERPDGGFAGVALGTIRLGYLRKQFTDLLLGDQAAINLFRADGAEGIVILRQPYREGLIGQNVASPRLLARIAQAPEGDYIGASAVDGITRVYHYKRIGDTTLYLDVGLAVDDVYAEWWHKTLIVGTILLAFFTVTIVLALGLKRELDRRGAAEAALLKVSREDALTGIANRRHFDEALAQAWRRATERGTCLSILLIDADNFKLFNDTYGHVAGDSALKALGSVLGATMDRPETLAARYGGEEFAVILPAIGRRASAAIAETLRRDVRGLAIPFAHAPGGVFTISIGVAWMKPRTGDRAGDLMTRADAALYASKQGGRDRVTTHEDMTFEAAA
jgi:diguanylate cyclase (GGDEF)-like protein